MVWLVTAFEAFGGATTNSSLIALEHLDLSRWRGKVEFFAPVPVTFAEAWPSVLREANRISSLKGILCLGQAEWRRKIEVEKIALNWIDARISDNAGVQLLNQKVEVDGPDILWSQIPWDRLKPDPDWGTSYSAGTYLCNSLMYNVVRWAKKNHKKAGFVHFPLLDTQHDVGLQSYLPRMEVGVAAQFLARTFDAMADGSFE